VTGRKKPNGRVQEFHHYFSIRWVRNRDARISTRHEMWTCGALNQTVSLTHNIINQKEKKRRFFLRDPLWFYQNCFIQQEEFRKGTNQEISMKRTKEFWLLIKINTTMHFGHPEEGTRKWHCGWIMFSGELEYRRRREQLKKSTFYEFEEGVCFSVIPFQVWTTIPGTHS